MRNAECEMEQPEGPAERLAVRLPPVISRLEPQVSFLSGGGRKPPSSIRLQDLRTVRAWLQDKDRMPSMLARMIPSHV
jgi:hypothetical protein